MAENSGSSAKFANRYRFQPVRADWDSGRSGYTHLVFDHVEERLCVIKRAELKDQKAVDELKNEVGALIDLKGYGVPEVYDTGEAEHGSKNYFYMIIEYIDALRVEKNLILLSASERKEIISQLFSILAKAHGMGIVNGDVDLKHLFWRRDKKQLVVIDWGNSKLDVDKRKQSEFSFDLARTAEIIYLLVTRKGELPPTGSIALPRNKKEFFSGLDTIPDEFRQLCDWAPRTPVKGAVAPYTAEELFKASSRKKKQKWITPTILVLGLALMGAAYLIFFDGAGIITMPTSPITKVPTSASPENPIYTETPTQETVPTITPSQVIENTPTPTQTLVPIVTPSPRTYTNTLLVFNKANAPAENCWQNSPSDTKSGFSRRESDQNWRFGIVKGQSTESPVQTSFSGCLEIQKFDAIALNIWAPRLELERDVPDLPGTIEPGKEFGIYVENTSGLRREYTIWIDKTELLHLRIRENGNILLDEIILVVNEEELEIKGDFPRYYAEFPIQIFFEINNQDLDIIYLQQGPGQRAVKVEELNPNRMVLIPNALLPTISNIKDIGLIGYGGQTDVLIWPLVFFGE